VGEEEAKLNTDEEEESKIEWILKLKTEIVFSDSDPIYLKSFSFTSVNYAGIRVKAEIYHTKQ